MTATARPSSRPAVVVGTDGSARGRDAVVTAAAEAVRRHLPLRIVHALTWPALPVALPPGLTEVSPAAARERAAQCLYDAVKYAADAVPGVVTETALVTGRPTAVLEEQSRHASLLVVGAHGLGGMLLGSVAGHVVAHAACPVLVVRGEPRPTGPVVAGVDGSPASAAVLDAALREASLRGTTLIALHAWSGSDWTELNSGLPMTYEFWSGEAQEQRVMAEAMAGTGDRYPDVPVRRRVVRGHAGPLLSELSQTAQLVVIGDHDRSRLAGPVSRHLIFHAGCPTLVVPARRDAQGLRATPP
ncbi:universal stress protein [Actinoplanes sp. NBRC 14428]|uniref:Nucleotide-binding universal stress UspA family protein n=1 Tax=Pseudosporangium ferrugineum TaxID=439699 RepID=A0A2T0SHT1_9ACTN|nr:universal stress protein [Pseudosporangium ferrugineum]PRY32974.1 nucleotide-binding universal stress UspA family protein [Pseudosporangium ferrugineum]BCJ49057.1 universal stress protein [Actinoplanes sp. NBRC 14428]